jgi:hypothetical protein
VGEADRKNAVGGRDAAGGGPERRLDTPAARDAGMDAEATVRDYYEALRRGEPLFPYFLERADVVKVGVGERLVGYDAAAEGLREQSRTTESWTVDSRDLRVRESGSVAWFTDRVALGWHDRTRGADLAFETRWSGTLERVDDEWLFAGMHVSTPVRVDDAGVPYVAGERQAEER